MTLVAILEKLLHYARATNETEAPIKERPRYRKFGDAEDEKTRLAKMMGDSEDLEPIDLTATRFQLDINGKWLSADRFWSTITGKPPEESTGLAWPGLAWVSVLDPSLLIKLHVAFVALRQRGVSFREEVTIIFDGKPKRALLELSLSTSHGGFDGRFSTRPIIHRPISQSDEYLYLPDYAETVWKRRHQIIKACLIAVTTVVCLTAIAFSWHSASQRSADTPAEVLQVVEGRKEAAREVRQAESVLRQYHASSSIEEMAQWVKGGPSILPNMRAFYKEEGNQPTSAVTKILR